MDFATQQGVGPTCDGNPRVRRSSHKTGKPHIKWRSADVSSEDKCPHNELSKDEWSDPVGTARKQ
eukprot:7667823-Pyramimonas_sp.AAC.1